MNAITGVDVRLGGSPVPHTTETKGEYTIVNLDLQLAAIRPGAEAKIDIKVVSSAVIKAKFGMYEFLQPRISSDFQITSYTLDLNYSPDVLPPVAYTSSLDKEPKDGKILMDSKSGFWVVWGNDAIIDLNGNIQVDGVYSTLVNIIPELPNQEVVYKQLDKVNGLIQDDHLNIWAVINPLQSNSATYQARVHNLPIKSYPLADIDYKEIPIPETLKSLLESKKQEEVINLIYTYLIETYQPEVEKISRLPNLTTELPPKDQKLLPIEYVYYLAGMLETEYVNANIVYGFQFSQFKSFNDYNLTLPQLWLEIPGEEVQIYDPYFQEVTEWKGINIPHINRVSYGVWDPQNVGDNVLGILSDRLMNNPQVTELGEVPNDFKITVAVDFPETALSGSYFEGKLKITNKSAIPLLIESIQLDGQDLSEQLLKVGSNYNLVARPNGVTEITIPQYMNLDVLRAYTKSGRVIVKMQSDILNPEIARYQIKFIPNYGLTAGIIISAVIIVGIVLVFIFRRQVLIRLMRRQYI